MQTQGRQLSLKGHHMPFVCDDAEMIVTFTASCALEMTTLAPCGLWRTTLSRIVARNCLLTAQYAAVFAATAIITATLTIGYSRAADLGGVASKTPPAAGPRRTTRTARLLRVVSKPARAAGPEACEHLCRCRHSHQWSPDPPK
jgi:hypothetical protein